LLERFGLQFYQYQRRPGFRKPHLSGNIAKGQDQLLTAWWFSNHDHNTISQLDWRWRVLWGDPEFQLVNVTAAN
jgi:hypothetical protein